ncbi:MAG: DUF4360 domain-containing protein [Pseudobacteriovorax sp.]|nr:DUF4360 domain-containing protein [Pseudobacteriovorax sp.]
MTGKLVLALAGSLGFFGDVLFANDKFEMVKDKPKIIIQDVNYTGSGCPLGSASLYSSNDAQSFILQLEQADVEAGPDVSIRERLKSCFVSIENRTDSKWQFAIRSVSIMGYLYLEEGMVFRSRASYYFGTGPQTSVSIKHESPIDDYIAVKDFIPLEGLQWSPCGVSRNLNLQVSYRINHKNRRDFPDASGFFDPATVGSMNESFGFELLWRSCD